MEVDARNYLGYTGVQYTGRSTNPTKMNCLNDGSTGMHPWKNLNYFLGVHLQGSTQNCIKQKSHYVRQKFTWKIPNDCVNRRFLLLVP